MPILDKETADKQKLRAYYSSDEWKTILRWCEDSIEENTNRIEEHLEDNPIVYSLHERMTWRIDIMKECINKMFDANGEPLKD